MRMRAQPLLDDASGLDVVLLSHAHAWLHGLPSCLHPKRLCRERPDIVNRLAVVWSDRRERRRMLEALAPDTPGGQLLSARAQVEAAMLYRYATGLLRVTYPPTNRRGPLPPVIVEAVDTPAVAEPAPRRRARRSRADP